MTPEISSLSNSFKTTSFFNVKLHNLQTGTEEKQLQSCLKKVKLWTAFTHSSIPVWGWTGSGHKPHTDRDIKTAEICEAFPGFSGWIPPTFHKHKLMDRRYTSLFDTTHGHTRAPHSQSTDFHQPQLGTLAPSQTKSFRVRGIKFWEYKSTGSI